MIPWDAAWSAALYGPQGFYRRPEGPAGHFRTASHAAAPILAAALTRVATELAAGAVVDIGAGRGELLNALASTPTTAHSAPDATPPVLHGVDVVERPPGLAPTVGWTEGLDRLDPAVLAGALVVVWEVLDVVPCPVVERAEDGELRVVLVDEQGTEALGTAAAAGQRTWCERWWPLPDPGNRAEVGRPRDLWWSELVQQALGAGAVALLAVDYAHVAGQRPPGGSLAAYRGGRRVPPVPDGHCDLTAHVALDSVAHAGEAAGARTLEFTDQRTALRRLGLRGRATAGEPVTAASLQRISAEAELIDPGGLGGFGWLLQGPHGGS